MEHCTLALQRIQVHVEFSGKGKPLVLIHGLGGPLMWTKVVPLFQEHYRVVVVHLPGFGLSSKPRSIRNQQEALYTIPFFTRILSEVLLSLVIEHPVVAGISLGGRVAVEYALSNSGCVEKLVLISSTGLSSRLLILKNFFLWKLFYLIAGGIVLKNKWLMCKFSERSFYDLTARPEDLCDSVFHQISQPGGREAWLTALKSTLEQNDGFAKRLRDLNVPTLILWGEHDRILSVKDALEFRSLIQNSSLVTLPQCGHSVPLEKPAKMAEVVRKFIEEDLSSSQAYEVR